jgi:ATP-binding cassette subfamily F protein uup
MPASPSKPREKKKLSFAEQHALKTLPEKIATLTAELAKLEQKLADPGLYARDPKSFSDTTMKIANARVELSAAEDEWLRLEVLREELEG